MHGRRAAMILLAGTGVAVLLIARGGSVLFSPGQAPVRVDFTDAVRAEETAEPVLADSGTALRIAVAAMISPKPTRQYYDDLLTLIAQRIGRRAEFLQRKTYAEVSDLVESRAVDLAFVCCGPYVTGKEKFGMELLVVPVVNGQSVYYCYILAGRDRDVRSLDDLRGRKFAFTDPDSNTGCLVPRFMLAERGATAESFFSETFFTHSHDASIQAVAEGVADGAAVDSLIWDFTDGVDNSHTSRTRIVEKSPPYGIPPVVVHPGVDPDLKRRLKAVFLSLHEDPEAAKLLARLRIERFIEGQDSMYDSVRRMQQWIAGTAGEGR
jgi:phosphonate transport system substrate-binding protein